MKKDISVSTDFGGRTLILSLNKFATRAESSVVCEYDGTTVFAVVSVSKSIRSGIDYMPLMIDYREKLYSSGKIKGSRWIKRLGRPTDEEVVLSRVIDRTLRPMIDSRVRNDVQITIIPLSTDRETRIEFPALIAASTALYLSTVPFNGPVSGIFVGQKDGEFIINPTQSQSDEMDSITTVCTYQDKVVMIEAEAKETPNDKLIESARLGLEEAKKIYALQDELKAKSDIKNKPVAVRINDEEFNESVEIDVDFSEFLKIRDIDDRGRRLDEVIAELQENAEEEEKGKIAESVHKNYKKFIRANILDNKVRVDGRQIDEVREITVEHGILPRVHGSGHFIRGVTEGLTIATLGSPGDVQLFENAFEEGEKRFFHLYNFPAYSVGEAWPNRGASRREIGHGALAEKALKNMIPEKRDFPYTIQLVSEILTSNGSSSMAATCGSTLALMDAGVPIKNPVAGVAMGLIVGEEGDDRFVVLTDIQGEEDHIGDMDFKIAVTKNGVTAIQMDTKLQGVSMEVIEQSFEKGRTGALFILDKMLAVIPEPKKELSPYAPRIETMKIDPDKIRVIIGKGGETIQKITAETGVNIDIEDDGTLFITSENGDAMKAAKKMIVALTYQPKAGDVFETTVTRVESYGVFVKAIEFPSIEGLIHVSNLGNGEFVKDVASVAKLGDKIKAKLMLVDDQGRLKFAKVG